MTWPDEDLYKQAFQHPYLSTIRAFIADSKCKAEQKQLLISGKIRNPQLEHINLADYKPDQVIARFKKELEALDQLENSDYSPQLIRVYQLAIKRNILEQQLITASIAQNWDKFLEYNAAYFGGPQTDHWSCVLYIFEQKLAEFEKNPDAAEHVARIRDAVDFNYDKEKAEFVHNQIIQPVPQQLKAKIQKTADRGFELPDQPSFSPQELVPIFTNALEAYSIKGWKVEIHPHFEGMTISAKDKTVYLPKSKPYQRDYLQRLICHEIGVHVTRGYLTTKQPYKILGRSKVAHTEEEGIAMVVEDALFERKSYAWLSYLCVGLALGMDGTKRDFKDLFEILENYYAAADNFQGQTSTAMGRTQLSPLSPQDRAWTKCIKTFMGTDYQTKGVCFYRIKDYFEMGVRCKALFSEQPEKFEYVMDKKYNFLDAELDKAINNLLI